MQISRVELGHLLQPRPVQDRQTAMMQRDQPLTPQLLQRAVDVDSREPEGVAQFELRERETARVILGQPDRAQAREHLTQEMSQMTQRRATAQALDPGP